MAAQAGAVYPFKKVYLMSPSYIFPSYKKRGGFRAPENRRMKDLKRKEKFLKKFGEHVKRIRTQQGYSQDRVYLESELSRATMSRIEHGQVDTQIWTLVRIAETLGVPLKKLIDVDLD